MSASKPSPRGIHVALALSLALNLFCLAFIGEQAWRSYKAANVATLADGLGEASSMRAVLRQVIATLPPQDAALLREGFAARLLDFAALRRQSLQAAEQVRTDIARQPFDADKTRSDMLASQDARQKTATAVREVLLEILPKMSDEGRSMLARYRLAPTRQ